MIFVTHELGLARELANQWVFLHQCAVEEQSPPREVFANPRSA